MHGGACSHQRTADTPADGGRADTPAGGGQADTGGGGYTTDGHTCFRYGGREDTEGAPTWRQGKVYLQLGPLGRAQRPKERARGRRTYARACTGVVAGPGAARMHAFQRASW
jgi:hypothetical protein